MSSQLNLGADGNEASREALGNVNHGFGSSDTSFHNKPNQAARLSNLSFSDVNVSDTSHDFLVIDKLADKTNDGKSEISMDKTTRKSNENIPLVPLKREFLAFFFVCFDVISIKKYESEKLNEI